MQLSSYIDHTILKPTATLNDIHRVCQEAKSYKFAAVCIPPPFVKQAKLLLQDSTVKVATVAGFPFGYSIATSKVVEAEQALKDGADEIDAVINLIALRSNAWTYLEGEMSKVIQVVHDHGKIIKVIIESGILSDEEIVQCCKMYTGLGIDFLKTSTGYAERGASVEAVQLMRKNLPSSIKIKASGGIKSGIFARQLIQAGAERLGCSASVEIIKEQSP